MHRSKPRKENSARTYFTSVVLNHAIAETWQKRPLAVGADSGCDYSCGEVELSARLRSAGFDAVWISEWSGFPHVRDWEPFCVKRSEFANRSPILWRYDQDLRAAPSNAHRDLGKRGGHPDVAAITPEGPFFLEYKGPGDSIKPKQIQWAAAAIDREHPRLAYVAVYGRFAQPNGTITATDTPVLRSTKPGRDSAQPLEPPRAGELVSPATRSKPAQTDRLHRRRIRDTLVRQLQWTIISRVDGTIDFTPPTDATSIDGFADEVRRAVESLGYQPIIEITTNSSGRKFVRVHTPETLGQAARGSQVAHLTGNGGETITQ